MLVKAIWLFIMIWNSRFQNLKLFFLQENPLFYPSVLVCQLSGLRQFMRASKPATSSFTQGIRYAFFFFFFKVVSSALL